MIHFCVTHYQNFKFCLVKSHSSYYSLSNSVTKTKMMKLIVTINSENVGRTISVEQIISIGRIATNLKIVSQQANMIVAHIDISKIYIYIYFICVLFHEHSQITGLQRKGEGIPLTPHYHFHLLQRHLDLCTQLAARLEPGTFDFRAQAANHEATRPNIFQIFFFFYVKIS